MTAYIYDKSWGQALLPLPWRAFFVLLSCVKMLSCRQAAGVLCCQLGGNWRAEKRAESKWGVVGERLDVHVRQQRDWCE